MIRNSLIKLIQNDDGLEKYQKDYLTDMCKMTEAWKKLSDDLLPMPISEKTEIKIREILFNIGEEMIKICELMIKENDK